MNSQKMQYLKSLTIIALFFGSAHWAMAEYVRATEEVYMTRPGSAVSVDIRGAGSVEFVGGENESELRFEINMVSWEDTAEAAEEMFDRLIVRFEMEGELTRLIIENKKKSQGWKLWGSNKWPQVTVRVICPGAYSVAGDTGSGSIRLAGISGELSFDTGSGDVRIEDAGGEVSVDTGSGSIRIENFNGDVEADTGSGDVRIVNLGGKLHADTGSGTVRAENVQGSVRADTGSGDVYVQGDVTSFHIDTGSGNVDVISNATLDSNASADTGSGQVSVRFAQTSQVDLNIKTNHGYIDVDVPNLQDVQTTKHTFKGYTNPEAPRLKLNTGSGDIRVRIPQ